jgi:hypothetical protein
MIQPVCRERLTPMVQQAPLDVRGEKNLRVPFH